MLPLQEKFYGRRQNCPSQTILCFTKLIILKHEPQEKCFYLPACLGSEHKKIKESYSIHNINLTVQGYFRNSMSKLVYHDFRVFTFVLKQRLQMEACSPRRSHKRCKNKYLTIINLYCPRWLQLCPQAGLLTITSSPP